MAHEKYDLAEHCINTREYLTIKINDYYFLFHRNIIQTLKEHELVLELPPTIIKTIFGSNSLKPIDVTNSCHVHPSLYDIIVFADKSIICTQRKLVHECNQDKDYVDLLINTMIKRKRLPYYVDADIELLKCCGISQKEIDFIVEKLDSDERIDLFNTNNYDQILQKVIDLTDISTRLKCRLVSKKWKTFVDRSPTWKCVRLLKMSRYFDRALNYFHRVDVRELDLSQSLFGPFEWESTNKFSLFSLRSLCVSIDHSLETLTLLIQMAPLLQYVKVAQVDHSSFKVRKKQLYEYIKLIICLCQNNLKYLRRLHIQVRSLFDQTFLESTVVAEIPIWFEVIKL